VTDALTRLSATLADRYRVERELGAGGMATVYLAEDLRHHRKVALKVLRPELAAVIGAERFLHEITTTANLQHPHILPLHDSGTVDGTVFYVMPFVEGETLRDRLGREKQLPIDDAVRIAKEVASALDYAHRHGVIHRDIKPENILLHDGQALVADFGIALAASSAGGSRMTETGMSLGTPTYMSPEQAMGERTLDARTDVYALGCVLYEMLTGEPPFSGPTAQSIVAKVMTERPAPIRPRRDRVPAAVEEAVLTALEKLPADRFASAAEFARALAGEATSNESGSRYVGRSVNKSPTAPRTSPLTVLLGVALVFSAALAAWGWLRPAPSQRTARYSVSLPEADNIFNTGTDVPAISPDGRRFVYSGVVGTLLVREDNDLRARPLPGSENGWTPAFSPDGGSVAFITGFPGALKIARLTGGAPTTLVSDSAWADGLAWSDDGWIYYPAREGTTLMRVRASGGASELVAQADTAKDELFLEWPASLPGGRALLVTVWRKRAAPDVAVLDVATKQLQILLGGVRALFAPTGHLVVVGGDGSVVAIPFDPRSLKLSGRPTTVLQGLRVPQGGKTFLAFSANGTLLYDASRPVWEVVRVTRDGTAGPVDPGWSGGFNNPALSPDGSRLAIGITNQGRDEIWVKALDTGPLTRIASAGSRNARPAWLPDGRNVSFTSDVEASYGLFRAAADGSGEMRPALSFSRSVDEAEWSRDGRWLVVRGGSGSGRHLYGIRPGVDSQPRPLARTEFEEFSPSLSPDGRWLAFASTASGKDEVYVQPFPNTESGKYQISPAGGTEPLWSHSGRELFYRNEKGDLVAAAIDPGAAFRVRAQRVLFSASAYLTDIRSRNYSVGPDDRTFYFIRAKEKPADTYVVVLNWFAELKAKVGQ
jgi:serine/threonine protein kinase/WD40 repeat protein